ncbi:hypothetical protein, partial [Streptomyces sp. ADI96-02]|uniref:hypothetical protein n=2 Tax=unclassified Streptomyces TaxID=2593676 RepID=UPI0013DDCEE0
MKSRTRGFIGVASAATAAMVIIPISGAGAAQFPEENRELMQIDIQNQTDEKLRLDFGRSAAKEKGGADSRVMNGVPQIPDAGFEVDGNGGTSESYGIDYVGTWATKGTSDMKTEFTYRNFFNVQASSVESSGRSQAV